MKEFPASRRWRLHATWAALLATGLLAACGGGSDTGGAAVADARGDSATPAPTPAPSPSPSPAPAAPQGPAPAPSPAPAPPPISVSGALRWSDPSTWGGTLPPAGSTIVIPAGRSIVLDTVTPPLKGLTIEGTLVASHDADVGITAEYVYLKGGRLQIGSSTQPYLRKATITLTGSTVADAVPGFGNKVLAMMGGTLEMHGRPVAKNWTRLDGGDVPSGSRIIRVADATGWQPGDQIVIATSSLDQNGYSLSTIDSISGNTITLREPTRFRHFGTPRVVGDVTVDVRAEVGLLTQNIVVQGDAASVASNIGGHTMLMAAGATTVQIANVQFQRMGQLDQLGRYPLHFHLMADGCTACYVRNNSIRDTVQRGLVIHGTSNVLAQGNVVFNTVGHNVMTENEATVRNTLDGNLALVNREPMPAHTEAVLVTQNDQNPANFWFRGADNAIVNNAAAGSQANGFIYDTPGPGNFNFRNNVVHAAMSQESKLKPGDFDTTAGVMIATDQRPVGTQDVLVDTLAYHNAHGLWAEESTVPFVFDRFIVAENAANGVQNRGVGSKQIYRNGVFIGLLPNSGVLTSASAAMHNQYGSDDVLENVTFANYAGGAGLGGTDTGPTQASYTISGVRFINTPGLSLTDLGRYTFKDDTALPRGFYVYPDKPWVAPPGAVNAAAGGATLLRHTITPGIGELEVRLAPGATFGQKIAAMVTRNDNLRYSINSGPGGEGAGLHSTTVLHSVPGVSYALEQASGYYAMRLWDTGGDPLLMRGQGTTLLSVPLASAPRSVARGGVTQVGNPGGDPGDGGDSVPSTGLTALRAAGSLADLNSNPTAAYFYDAVARRLWVNITPAWLVVQQ